MTGSSGHRGKAPAVASQRWYGKMGMKLRNSGLITDSVSIQTIRNFETELGGLHKHHTKTHGSNFINVI